MKQDFAGGIIMSKKEFTKNVDMKELENVSGGFATVCINNPNGGGNVQPGIVIENITDPNVASTHTEAGMIKRRIHW